MKLRTLVLAAAALAFVFIARADIIDNTLTNDGDGVMTCYTYGFLNTGPQQFELSVDGVQHQFATGHILGDIIANNEADPSLHLLNDIDNDTSFDWTDYHVEITLNKTFSFSNVTATNTGWTSVVGPVNQVGSDWIGTIDYYSGTPVLIGQTFSFGYAITFAGSVNYCAALTPSAVPEPGSVALVAGGLASLWLLRRRA